jgi:hypothetical protein
MELVSSGGPIGLSVKRLLVLWVSAGCVNGTAGLVYTQCDLTRVGPTGQDVASEAISFMRLLFWNALQEDNG